MLPECVPGYIRVKIMVIEACYVEKITYLSTFIQSIGITYLDFLYAIVSSLIRQVQNPSHLINILPASS